MRVLIACEFSGVVRDAFAARGHYAMSCDLLPTESPGPHYRGDIRYQLDQGWDLMIAHPPCTYLANSGVQHLRSDRHRWYKMFDGAEFFQTLHRAPIPKICVENPIMHRYAKLICGNQSQIVQPWMFGHLEQKATCLWLKGLPLLKPTNDVRREMMKLPVRQRQRLHWLGPSPNRQQERSTTFQGLAEAMAGQWG